MSLAVSDLWVLRLSEVGIVGKETILGKIYHEFSRYILLLADEVAEVAEVARKDEFSVAETRPKKDIERPDFCPQGLEKLNDMSSRRSVLLELLASNLAIQGRLRTGPQGPLKHFDQLKPLKACA